MDKQTRWLRVEVPTRLYDEIARLAKLDDREPHVFLRRHLEHYFCQHTCKCGPKEYCLECADYLFCGTEIRATSSVEKYQVSTEKGLIGESVHGLPSCEGGGHIGPCGCAPCAFCYPPAKPPVCLHDSVEDGIATGIACPCEKCSTQS